MIGKEIKYAAETEQMDKGKSSLCTVACRFRNYLLKLCWLVDLYGPMENPSDWDSLSDRLRKTRRNQKTLLQQHRGECTPNTNYYC